MAMFSIASSVRNTITGQQQRHQQDSSRDTRKEDVVRSIFREMARTSVADSDEADVLDKINFSKVKEIKNNSFNKKDFFDLMRDGKERLRSFQVGPWTCDVDTLEMAEAGFYFLQNEDRVQCPYCEIVLDGWHPEDDPLLEHARHSSRCPFIAGYDVKNIPIRADPVRGPGRRLPDWDVCGNHNFNSRSSDEDEIMTASSDEENEETAGLSSSPSSSQESASWPMAIPSLRQGPIHRSYVSYGSRLKTFDSPRWPRDCPIPPSRLAEAGFFYYGPFMGQQDSVKCFSCDTGLCQWEASDDPWEEHKRVSPSCEFVELNYTPNGGERRNMNTQDVAEEWISSSLVQEFLKNYKCSKNVVKNVLSQRWLKVGSPFKTSEELKAAVASYDPLSKLLKKNEHDHKMNCKDAVKGGWSQSWSTRCTPSSSQGSQQSSSSCNSYESGFNSCPGSDSEETLGSRGRLTCKVCWDDDVGCIIRPCNHVATCTKCAPALTNCPICRKQISLVEKVYF